jgi:DNA-binding GntR family transcriptional regulator
MSDTGTVLSNSGLVTFSPYKGASVCVVDAQLAKSVYDIRLVLEPEVVRRTVEHRDSALLDDAAKALKESSVAITNRDQAALSLLNRQFHRALYSGCGNPQLVNVLHDLKDRAG